MLSQQEHDRFVGDHPVQHNRIKNGSHSYSHNNSRHVNMENVLCRTFSQMLIMYFCTVNAIHALHQTWIGFSLAGGWRNHFKKKCSRMCIHLQKKRSILQQLLMPLCFKKISLAAPMSSWGRFNVVIRLARSCKR